MMMSEGDLGLEGLLDWPGLLVVGRRVMEDALEVRLSLDGCWPMLSAGAGGCYSERGLAGDECLLLAFNSRPVSIRWKDVTCNDFLLFSDR